MESDSDFFLDRLKFLPFSKNQLTMKSISWSPNKLSPFLSGGSHFDQTIRRIQPGKIQVEDDNFCFGRGREGAKRRGMRVVFASDLAKKRELK